MAPRKTKPTTAAARIIACFGGITATATALRCAKSTVQRWCLSGVIHQRHHKRILDGAVSADVVLDINDFISVDKRHPAFMPLRRRDRVAA